MRFRITIDIDRRQPPTVGGRDVDMAGASADMADRAQIGFTIPNPSVFEPPEENR